MQSRGNSIAFLRVDENLDPGVTIQGAKRLQKWFSALSRLSSGSTEYSCLQHPEPTGPNLPLTAGLLESLQKLARCVSIGCNCLFVLHGVDSLESTRPEHIMHLLRGIPQLPQREVRM